MATTYNETLGARSIAGATSSGTASTATLLDFTDGADYTYDTNNIEFTGGVAALKNQFASDVVMAATFATAKTLNYSRDGGVTSALAEAGTVAISGSKLVLNAGGTARITYKALNNTPKLGIGAVKFMYTPNYTGSPATGQYLYVHQRELNTSVNYVQVQHWTDGALNYLVKNYANTTVGSGSTAWSPTSGVEYEIEFNWDMANNSYAFYVDGVRVANTGSGAYSPAYQDSLIGRITIGDNDGDAGIAPNFSIRKLIVYDAVKHTGASYTPAYSVPTKYLTTDPTIALTSGIVANGLASFGANVEAAGSDGIKFHIKVDGTAKYWNGSAWANSNASYAQSNTAAEINTNAASLAAGTYVPVAVLHSNDGSTTPYLAGITLGIE